MAELRNASLGTADARSMVSTEDRKISSSLTRFIVRLGARDASSWPTHRATTRMLWKACFGTDGQLEKRTLVEQDASQG